MNKHRLHLLAIPHTVTHHDYVACAYTQKVLKFAKMMTNRGHHVIHYGHENSDVVCSEHVTVTDQSVLDKAYGNLDWKKNQFVHNVADFAHVSFNARAAPEVLRRAKRGDFLLCTWGYGHQFIAKSTEHTGIIQVEPGVGYPSGHFLRWRAYESHAIRNVVEGNQNPQNWYSWVIPNYFDVEDFDYEPVKDDYILFLGRVTELKGISTCVQATAAAGKRLIIAGQGSLLDCGYTAIPPHVTELGYADKETRRKLMAKAQALIIATTYLEPFGGVVVEAMLSGTPIITPHFGAFSEIQTEKTGFMCYTLRDYVNAIKNIDKIKPEDCRARGLQYTFEAVAPKFESWFDALTEVHQGEGWVSL